MAIEMALYRHCLSPDCEDCHPVDGPCATHLAACEICGSHNAMNHGPVTRKRDRRGTCLHEMYCDRCFAATELP